MDLTGRLATEGHQLVTASNGREALDRVEREGFDLILADVKIANIDGIELVRRIKGGPTRPRSSC